MKNNSY